MIKRLLVFALLALAVPPSMAAAQAVPDSAPAAGEVVLAPGDILQVKIWREPDLGGDFQVDLDGVAILPLIGEQRVTGIPVRRLREMLIQAYSVHLRNPSINITPLRRIHVVGEVREPGVFQVDPTVSLGEAIALAGGVTPAGDIRRIRIVRRGGTEVEAVRPGALVRDADIRSGDQIYVDRRPWLARNSGWVVGTALSVTNLVLNVIRLRS